GPRGRAGGLGELDPLAREVDRLRRVHRGRELVTLQLVVLAALAGELGHEARVDGGPRAGPAERDAVLVVGPVGEVDRELDEVVERLRGPDAAPVELGLV